MADIDAMITSITHDLGRCIEAHGLRIQESRGKDRGIMTFEPGRHIDEMREARRMAFGKAIFTEALDLAKAALSEFRRIATLDHAPHHLLLEPADGGAVAEGGHGPA